MASKKASDLVAPKKPIDESMEVSEVAAIKKSIDEKLEDQRRKFIMEPMGDKLVTVLPGISDGPEAGPSFNEAGITFAKQVYGHYLIKSPDDFKKFLGKHHVAGSKGNGYQDQIYEIMKEYDELSAKLRQDALAKKPIDEPKKDSDLVAAEKSIEPSDLVAAEKSIDKEKKSIIDEPSEVEKSVTEIPGIGDYKKAAPALKLAGITLAKQLYGYYLIYSPDDFKKFLGRHSVNASAGYQDKVYENMKAYDEKNIKLAKQLYGYYLINSPSPDVITFLRDHHATAEHKEVSEIMQDWDQQHKDALN